MVNCDGHTRSGAVGTTCPTTVGLTIPKLFTCAFLLSISVCKPLWGMFKLCSMLNASCCVNGGWFVLNFQQENIVK